MLWQPLNDEQLHNRIQNFKKRKMREFPELADTATTKDEIEFGSVDIVPQYRNAIFKMS